MDIPTTDWHITTPGVLSWPTTKFEIRTCFTKWGIEYQIWYDGVRQSSVQQLNTAKDVAARLARDLLATGIEI